MSSLLSQPSDSTAREANSTEEEEMLVCYFLFVSLTPLTIWSQVAAARGAGHRLVKAQTTH